MKSVLKTVLVTLVTIAFVQCKEDVQFKIVKGQVGKLSATTKIKELKKIFENDSIITNLSEGEKGGSYMQDEDEYIIYEKGGKHLLTIIPKDELDSTSTIKSIQVFDPRYKTEKGLNVNSTFQEINASSAITENNIESSISSVVLKISDVPSLDIRLMLNKEDLGLKGFSLDQKISPDRIPDLAKVKSFIIWFN